VVKLALAGDRHPHRSLVLFSLSFSKVAKRFRCGYLVLDDGVLFAGSCRDQMTENMWFPMYVSYVTFPMYVLTTPTVLSATDTSLVSADGSSMRILS
jgi:hypothetical protein